MAQQMSETPVLDLLAGMTALSLETSTLDTQGIMLARIAALVATDAPPISYALNLGVAGQGGVGAEQNRGGVAAVAPPVGTAEKARARGKNVKARAPQEAGGGGAAGPP